MYVWFQKTLTCSTNGCRFVTNFCEAMWKKVRPTHRLCKGWHGWFLNACIYWPAHHRRPRNKERFEKKTVMRCGLIATSSFKHVSTDNLELQRHIWTFFSTQLWGIWAVPKACLKVPETSDVWPLSRHSAWLSGFFSMRRRQKRWWRPSCE